MCKAITDFTCQAIQLSVDAKASRAQFDTKSIPYPSDDGTCSWNDLAGGLGNSRACVRHDQAPQPTHAQPQGQIARRFFCIVARERQLLLQSSVLFEALSWAFGAQQHRRYSTGF